MLYDQFELHQSRIFLGSDCFAEALARCEPSAYSRCFFISQEQVWGFHGQALAEAFAASGVTVSEDHLYFMPDGEQFKSLATFEAIQQWLVDRGADRRSLLVVLGGGVVGDLAGFVAATYMRGMAWLYVPTTLLAQQDASIGGKTAVNLPQGKNLVGQFWEPRAVIVDSAVLGTLPQRQINAGYMEFLKHGMLQGEALYQDALAVPTATDDWAAQMPVLARGVRVKADVVAQDPHEKNQRRLLNLGHTLAHALESYTEYRQFLHGEAVGIGLLYVAMVARRLGSTYAWPGLMEAVVPRLPACDPANWDQTRLLDLTRRDKKGVGGKIAWIIPHRPGDVEIITGIDRAVLAASLEELVAVLGDRVAAVR
ncbi:3-dehydroquinate synthase [Acanthopleuribacter pedis]|uniref:3-dehydroquinate synthase n=1 Tax=Acanthopleuribacter pedis TaxID=442870 RepID=A0A8J7U4M6_9BACT|nr:3-dehydroquinate synthase family protein [Acanthopleuribacter pedis]MBO1319949.1 3-dehydroquinate synthase [Acanthopleuribacter pedis]